MVSLMLGNYIAGNNFALHEVVSEPVNNSPYVATQYPSLFPNCVLACAKQEKLGGAVDLSDTFLCQEKPLKDKISESDTDVPPKDDIS